MPPIRTYRDPKNPANIMTEDGKRISGPTEYTQGVDSGQYLAAPDLQQKQAAPSISRDGAGFSLNGLTGNAKLMEAAKQIIISKQNFNKDLTDRSAYWKGLISDTGAFGAPRAPEAARTGNFDKPTDINFREASPNAQASIRASRNSTARAYLSSIDEERKYRGNIMADTLKSLDSMMKESDKLDDKTNDDLKDAWTIFEKKLKAKLPISDEDYEKIGYLATDGRIGGSISWRNRNPGNLKFAEWQTQYGAKKDPRSDYAIFPNDKAAQAAYKALLTSPTGIYAGLDPDEAMWKWSGSGEDTSPSYTYQDLVKYGAPAISKEFKYFNEQEWAQFFNAQKIAEGWEEDTDLSEMITSANNFTDTQLNSASQALGIDVNSSDGKRGLINYTTNELNDALRTKKEDIVNSAVKGLNDKDLAYAGISDINEAKAIVENIANKVPREIVIATLKSFGMENVGEKYDAVDAILKKKSADELMLEKLDNIEKILID